MVCVGEPIQLGVISNLELRPGKGDRLSVGSDASMRLFPLFRHKLAASPSVPLLVTSPRWNILTPCPSPPRATTPPPLSPPSAYGFMNGRALPSLMWILRSPSPPPPPSASQPFLIHPSWIFSCCFKRLTAAEEGPRGPLRVSVRREHETRRGGECACVLCRALGLARLCARAVECADSASTPLSFVFFFPSLLLLLCCKVSKELPHHHLRLS